mgnify:CR=1 FL=1
MISHKYHPKGIYATSKSKLNSTNGWPGIWLVLKLLTKPAILSDLVAVAGSGKLPLWYGDASKSLDPFPLVLYVKGILGKLLMLLNERRINWWMN